MRASGLSVTAAARAVAGLALVCLFIVGVVHAQAIGAGGGGSSSSGGSPSGTASGDLAGSYPSPSVAAVTTGATSLTIGTLTDGQMLTRSGTTIASAAIPTALPPNGSASGDLSGTFPSPAVAALTTSSGRFTLAAVTDGQMLTRSGTTITSAAIPTGNVVGPASNTSNAVATYSGTTGKLLQDNTGVTIASNVLTTTGGFISSGVTNDLQSPSNEDLVCRSQGTGNLILDAGSGAVQIRNSNGTVAGEIIAGTTNARFAIRNAGNNYALALTGTGASIGAVTDVNATTLAGCLADQVNNTSSTCLISAFGSGKLVYASPQSATCTNNAVGSSAGTLTLDATSSVVLLTNSDPDGCVVTLSETSALSNTEVEIVIVSNAGGTVTFPTSAGVHVSGLTGCTTTGVGVASAYKVFYAPTLLEYVGVSCSSN